MSIYIRDLFDLSHTRASSLLERYSYPWEVLPEIGAFIKELSGKLGEEFMEVAPNVWVHKSVTIAGTASITGPCIIDAGTEVRHCAFIRGNALIGRDCVVGNSTELKNVILFDHVQVPHYNYVGDSILGYYAHMGAGSITSNVKSDKTSVIIKDDGVLYDTGKKKVGAMLGDYVEIGCGSVLNPGSIIGRNTNIYPLSSVRGVIPPDHVYKKQGEVARKYT